MTHEIRLRVTTDAAVQLRWVIEGIEQVDNLPKYLKRAIHVQTEKCYQAWSKEHAKVFAARRKAKQQKRKGKTK